VYLISLSLVRKKPQNYPLTSMLQMVIMNILPRNYEIDWKHSDSKKGIQR
jgi:hypothetical protein